ncbi:hypothetical protein AHAS_Ahas12G0108900 [Arachis hypogaea]
MILMLLRRFRAVVLLPDEGKRVVLLLDEGKRHCYCPTEASPAFPIPFLKL